MNSVSSFKLLDYDAQSEAVREWVAEYKQTEGVHFYDEELDRIALISVGQRGNMGYKLELEKTEEDDQKVVVFIKETIPKPGMYYPMMITWPHLVAIVTKPLEVWLTTEGEETRLFFREDGLLQS